MADELLVACVHNDGSTPWNSCRGCMLEYQCEEEAQGPNEDEDEPIRATRWIKGLFGGTEVCMECFSYAVYDGAWDPAEVGLFASTEDFVQQVWDVSKELREGVAEGW